MPVVGGGSFTLYGYSLSDPGGLVAGEPPDGYWHIKNVGFVPFQVGVPIVWTGPTKIDTNHGVNLAAGSPPAGFHLKTRPLFTGPILHPGWSGLNPINNDGVYDMGGKTGLTCRALGPGPGIDAEQDDTLLLYVEILTFHKVNITRVDGFPFDIGYFTTAGGASSPAPSSPGLPSGGGPSITGSYDIIAWWWVIPDVTPCGDVNTPNPNDSTSHLTLALSPDPPPGAGYQLFDPEDPNDGHPTPVIKQLDPNHGPRGTEVTIWGSGFGDGADVKFDGVSASDIVVVNQYKITCKAPAHALGFANVHVINSDGVSS